MNRPSIDRAEYAERRSRAAALARQRGLDGLLVWSRGGVVDAFHDVHYFTSHFDPVTWLPPVPGLYTALGHAAVVITADGDSVLVASDFVRDDVAIEEVRHGYDLSPAVCDALSESGLAEGTVGILGTEVLPYALATTIADALPRFRFVPADDISSELRRQLSVGEIEMMRHAGAVGGAIYDRAIKAATPGATEGDAVGAGFAFAATIPGCAHWSFLGAGRDASLLHRSPLPPWEAATRYQRGDVLHYDCYGFVDGYAYDLARTFVVGEKASREQDHLTNATAAACAAMADRLLSRPTFADLHAIGLATLRDAGVAPVAAFGSTESDSPGAIGPGFGHCIGAGFFAPLVIPQGPHADVVVEPPCGISFEVFATDGHDRYAYHEDNYIVTGDAVEVVSRLPA